MRGCNLEQEKDMLVLFMAFMKMIQNHQQWIVELLEGHGMIGYLKNAHHLI